MTDIPFVNRSIDKSDAIHQEILFAISEVMDSGRYVLAGQLEQLEETLAQECGCQYAVGVNSGTDALFLTMKAFNIGPDDEVIVPSNIFCAVANSVCATGARPVFCDPRYEDMLIDPEKIVPLITKKTKAVIPVHLTGMPCDMDEINQIAENYGLYVIEDAAQAIGAEYKGNRAGSLGVAGCFSFHPLKNIHALGDGGAVMTNDQDLYRRLLELRNHGLNEGEVVRPGFNSRLDESHAAAINIQFAHLEEINERKRTIAARYIEALKTVAGINGEPDYKRGVYQLYMIKTPKRDDLAEFLAEKGIGTSVHYRSYVPFHPYYLERFGRPEGLHVTERLSREVLSLPIYYGMRDDEIDYVVKAVAGYFEGKR